MNRRDFFKKAITSGIAAGTFLAFPRANRFWNTPSYASSRPYDLVAVRGEEPDIMFDAAMNALGGIGSFVPRGSQVLVKPNIGWDVPAERAGNTHPALVEAIVAQCLGVGASKVSVFDHTCDNWRRCYKNSGIALAVKRAGGRMISGDSQGYYKTVTVPSGLRLKEAKVHQALLDADVFINVPILKHHSSTMLSIGMKNLMGVVWDRGFWHRNDLHQCIADFSSLRKPDLTVVDAYNVMARNGPRGVSVNDVISMKAQVISRDPVAADAAATKLFGMEPRDIRYIKIASQMNIGQMNLDHLTINRIKL